MKINTLIVILILSVLSIHAGSQSFLKTNGKKIANGKGDEVILRGMGLGGWMLQEGYMLRVNKMGQQHVIRKEIEKLIGTKRTQDFYDAWLANHLRKIDIDSMASWGFNSIRLPMHYNLFTPPIEDEATPGNNTWLEKGFVMTDSLLKWCAANKMYLILDLHATPGGQGNDVAISDRDPLKPSLWQSEANQQKVIALWKKLAERYANEPWIGGYDMINEPNWGFDHENDKNGCNEETNLPLRKLLIDITHAIREVDKNHIVIIEGNCWGNNYKGVFPLWDDNMVVSFHKYWNYNDKGSVQGFINVRDQYNVPVWAGETGENSNLWYRDAINLFENNSIGWAWWPLKKLGFNNPLQIKLPAGYQGILDYWNGTAPKPLDDEAARIFMELAENTKLENCIYHKDVIDAMFRQTKSDDTKPFTSNKVKSGTVINAVDYDLGRNGKAYFDTDTANYYISTGGERTPWNRGQVYRNDGVDIESDKSTHTFYVNHIESGEWLQYTLNVQKAGKYTVRLSVSSNNNEGKIALTSTGGSKEIPIPDTGGEAHWKVTGGGIFNFQVGIHTLRVKAIKGGYAFKSIELKIEK